MEQDFYRQTEEKSLLSAQEICMVLAQALEMLMGLRGHLGTDVSPHTGMAIGIATGELSKAVAMCRRDIELNKRIEEIKRPR